MLSLVKIVPLNALFSRFGHKVTKKYLYLHLKTILIKLKNKEWRMKIVIYQDENLILQNKDDNFTLKNKQ